MTVAVETPAVIVLGDGSQTSFPIPFYFRQAADIVVSIDGVALIAGDDFNIVGTNIQFVGAPDAGVRVAVARQTPIQQTRAFPTADSIKPVSIGDALDERAMVDQELNATQARAVTVPIGEDGMSLPPIATRGGLFAAFGAAVDGAPLIASPGPYAGVVAGTFGASLVGSVDQAAALPKLGIVNIYNEVTINAASFNIPNIFPATYLVNDLAVPADYNIFLPGGAAAGSLVFIRVAITATKVFTLYDGSTWENGDDRIMLWAGESVMLKKVAGAWKRVGGIKLPIHGTLKRTAALAGLASGVNTGVPFTACVNNYLGLQIGFDSVGGRFKAPRTGLWRFHLNLCTYGSADLQQALAVFKADSAQLPPPMSIQYGRTGSPRLQHSLTVVQKIPRGQGMGVEVNIMGTAPGVDYFDNTIECLMDFEEIIT